MGLNVIGYLIRDAVWHAPVRLLNHHKSAGMLTHHSSQRFRLADYRLACARVQPEFFSRVRLMQKRNADTEIGAPEEIERLDIAVGQNHRRFFEKRFECFSRSFPISEAA